MILTDEQIERAHRLVSRTDSQDGQWLENRLHDYVSATAYGEDRDVEEAGRRLYAECPEWIGRKLFGPDFRV
jgi:hypothetical protein